MRHSLAAVAVVGSLVTGSAAEPEKPPVTLTREHASAFARLALKGVSQEFPHKPGHVLDSAADVKRPRAAP